MSINGIGMTGIAGMDYFIMQSQENLFQTKELFDRFFATGLDAATAYHQALNQKGLRQEDFTSSDWQSLIRYVEQTGRSSRY